MKFFYTTCLILLTTFLFAQDQLQISQKTYDVKKLVDGELSLYKEQTTGHHYFIIAYNDDVQLLSPQK